jgi:hypothetical protein
MPSSLAVDSVNDRIARFIDSDEPLDGTELYDLLESVTPLSRLRQIFRQGDRNRLTDGTQQSYAQHNRMLLLGLDRLFESDLRWYLTRVAEPETVTQSALLECFEVVRTADLTRGARVAVWVAAALHDCGMLVETETGVDVEDGVVVAAEVVDTVCPSEFRDVTLFAIHHHDYIKDVFTGEAPALTVSSDLAALPIAQRGVAMLALGMIQVAGAASLGEGRLSEFRMNIFSCCSRGTALEDTTSRTRLERLGVRWPVDLSRPLQGLIENVPVHGWHRAWESAPGEDRTPILERLADVWADIDSQHIVLGPAFDTAAGGGWSVRERTLLNGARVAVIG